MIRIVTYTYQLIWTSLLFAGLIPNTPIYSRPVPVTNIILLAAITATIAFIGSVLSMLWTITASIVIVIGRLSHQIVKLLNDLAASVKTSVTQNVNAAVAQTREQTREVLCNVNAAVAQTREQTREILRNVNAAVTQTREVLCNVNAAVTQTREVLCNVKASVVKTCEILQVFHTGVRDAYRDDLQPVASSGVVSNLAASSGVVDNLAASSGVVDNLAASSGVVDNLAASSGVVSNLGPEEIARIRQLGQSSGKAVIFIGKGVQLAKTAKQVVSTVLTVPTAAIDAARGSLQTAMQHMPNLSMRIPDRIKYSSSIMCCRSRRRSAPIANLGIPRGSQQVTQPVQTGTQPVQTGTQPVQTGTQPVQTGTQPVQTGTQPVQTGTQQVVGQPQ